MKREHLLLRQHRFAGEAHGSVPHLAELKSACTEEIASYRSCLDSHASLPDEVVADKCGGLMSALWKCSEKAMASIEARTAGAAAGSTSLTAARLV